VEAEYLSRKGVDFTQRDVTADDAAMQELVDLGAMATPTTVIDGEHVIIGFDQQRIDKLLGL